MKKILLIAYRDFIIRCRNKTFLISTLLLPLGVIGFYGAIIFFTSNDTDVHRIGIVDAQGLVAGHLTNEENFEFKFLNGSTIKKDKAFGERENIDALVYIPADKDSFLYGKIDVVTFTKLGIITKNKLESIIQDYIEKERYSKMNMDSSKIAQIKTKINIDYQSVTGSTESEVREAIAYALSFGLGIMMYVILTIYGAQVMRGVMEEKTNRIVEIIISSVKPFELLMGKIIGIGMVSFLQLAIWAILLTLINIGIGLFFGIQYSAQDISTLSQAHPMASQMTANNPMMLEAIKNIQQTDFLPILVVFLFYFLGGYFLYSSLFAAVGSAVGDDPQDVQALMFPIMIPIILSFVFLSKSVNNPNSTEAIVASMVPFTSPVVMMSRVVFGIPEGVPLWQLLLSMFLLLITTVFFIFLAARIYKIGILLYGKKANWKDMLQWVFVK